MAASANHLAAGLRPLPHSRQPRLPPPFSPLPSPPLVTRREKRRGEGGRATRSVRRRPDPPMTGRRPQHATPSSGDSSTSTDVLALSRQERRGSLLLLPRSAPPTPRHATDRASPAPTHAMDPARAPPQGPPRSTTPSASARPHYLTTRRHGHGWTFPCCHARRRLLLLFLCETTSNINHQRPTPCCGRPTNYTCSAPR